MKAPSKKYPRRCVTPRCRGLVISKACHSNKCAKCRMRDWNEKFPLQRAFHNLRSHAKERGKDFTLTFEQFKIFAEKTDYMSRKGKTSLSLQIDRVKTDCGYHLWNIRAVTLRENTRRQFVPYFRDWMERTMAQTVAEISECYS